MDVNLFRIIRVVELVPLAAADAKLSEGLEEEEEEDDDDVDVLEMRSERSGEDLVNCHGCGKERRRLENILLGPEGKGELTRAKREGREEMFK